MTNKSSSRKLKTHRTAVLRFSGRVNKKLEQKMDEMKDSLEMNNLKPKSNFIVA